MVVVGIDAHKRTHTAVAVDEQGRRIGTKTVAATSAGHLELVRWAQSLGEHRFAVEDCRHLSRRLERDLLSAGRTLTRVPPKLMAQARRSARERGKSGHLHELDPTLEIAAGSLGRTVVLDRLAAICGTHSGTVAAIAAELVETIRVLSRRINELERQIKPLVESLVPSLLELPGCGTLSAAKVIGETAGVDRFADRARFARFNGTAPIPVWSSNTSKFRLNRGGNRQVNAALHRIAVTQLRGGPGKDYVDRRIASGKTKTEAIRALRRRISDEVYRRLTNDYAAQGSGQSTCIALAA